MRDTSHASLARGRKLKPGCTSSVAALSSPQHVTVPLLQRGRLRKFPRLGLRALRARQRGSQSQGSDAGGVPERCDSAAGAAEAGEIRLRL